MGARRVGAQRGGGPNPEKVRARRVGGPKGGGPKGWARRVGAQNFAGPPGSFRYSLAFHVNARDTCPSLSPLPGSLLWHPSMPGFHTTA